MHEYPVKNDAAQSFCAPRWRGVLLWPSITPCLTCPLYSKCSDEPKVPGIEAYTKWIDSINEEANRLAGKSDEQIND